MKAVAALLQAFLAIALFRKRPQDLPGAPLLLYLTVSTFTLVNLGIAGIDLPPRTALLIGLENSLIPLVFTLVLLAAVGYGNRITQTLTAQAGAGTVLNVVGIPVAYWMSQARAAQQPAEGAFLLWLLLFVWGLFVSAHIYRHAFGTRLFVGFLLTLALLGVLLPILQWSLPEELLAARGRAAG